MFINRLLQHKVCVIFLFVLLFGCQSQRADIPARADYTSVTKALERVITREMEDKQFSAVSIALVDDQEIVWAKGFGMADPDKKTVATAETVYRIASLSKLFTDMSVMQLAEGGKIDIDAPITDYLPNFQPQNSFGKRLTLRQIMSHRAGIVREPPVGHYFDPTEPTVAQLVESLNQTALVYEPETRTKYSNAGISVAGFAVEKVAEKPFIQYIQAAILDPIGMTRSAYEPLPEIKKHLAKGYMWTYDGRTFEAPTFQLGMVPAAGMYSTVKDLARFMKVLFNNGEGPGGAILKPETLAKMYEIQYASEEQKSGFGLGFYVNEFEGKRKIGHGGVMYGYATQIAALPDEKLGVVTIITLDAANEVANRINNYAFKLMLAKKEGKVLPEFDQPGSPIPTEVIRKIEGTYVNLKRTVELKEQNGKLFLYSGSIRAELKSIGDTLITDDPLGYGVKIVPQENGGIIYQSESLSRLTLDQPTSIPKHWNGLIGEYGWDHNTLYILEKYGKLYTLIEWFFYYPLEEISRNVYAFPNYGLYHGEKLIFDRDDKGYATQVEAANVVFKRRPAGMDGGATFKIKPLKESEELRKTALAANPPAENRELEADLVDITQLDNTIKLDIRYSSTNNFMSTVFYEQAKAFMQRPAAEALVRVHRDLKKMGYGLLIHDAYRPWYVTKMFWDATPESLKHFVADPQKGSRHNRGCAVDLTLYDLKTGETVDMVATYDEFSDRSFPYYPGGTSQQRWLRKLLRNSMEAEGFEIYQFEWWHFDYETWQKYPISNLTFEGILNQNQQ